MTKEGIYMKKKVKLSLYQLLIAAFFLILFGVFFQICREDNFKKFIQFTNDIDSSFNIIYTIISGIALTSLLLLRKQIKSEHERARREKSVDLVLEWSKKIKIDDMLSRAIINKLSQKQVKLLFDEQEFEVDAILYNTINSLLHLDLSSDCPKKLPLTTVIQLRACIISYLDLLEGILLAWQENIVDRKIIEKEFSPLIIAPETNIIEKFIYTKDFDETFPAIVHFHSELTRKKIKKNIGRKKNKVA